MSDESRQNHEVGSGEPTDADLYFIKSGEGRQLLPFPGVEIMTTAGDQMMLSVVYLDENAVVPEHAHPHEQMGMMIAGELEFTIGGVTRIVEAGDIWRIPSNVPHQARAVGGSAVALDVFHPVREDYR